MLQRRSSRDNIQGITKPVILRIAHRGGAKSLSGLMYSETRGVLRVFLKELVRLATISMNHARRSTYQAKDLEFALNVNNKFLMAGVDSNSKNTSSLKGCKLRKRAPKKAGEGSKKPHRFRPGTVALREIKYNQKNSDCLLIPHLPFARLLREIVYFEDDDNSNPKPRLSDAFTRLTQLVAEDYLTGLYEDATILAIHAGRVKIMPSDLMTARRIRKERA